MSNAYTIHQYKLTDLHGPDVSGPIELELPAGAHVIGVSHRASQTAGIGGDEVYLDVLAKQSEDTEKATFQLLSPDQAFPDALVGSQWVSGELVGVLDNPRLYIWRAE